MLKQVELLFEISSDTSANDRICLILEKFQLTTYTLQINSNDNYPWRINYTLCTF